MICKSCKREVPEQSIFCLFCGEKLVRSRSRKEVSVPKPKTLADGTLFGRIMIDGVRYPVHGKTEAEYRANVIAMKEGVLEAAKPDNRLVRDVVAEYIRIRESTGKCSVTTIDSYLRRARSNLQSIMSLRVKELNTKTMQTAVDRDKLKYSGKTIHEAVSLVSSATGVKFPGLVKPDKAPKKKPPVYSSEELRRLILALAEIGGEGECAALLAMWLSLRRSEIKGLKWEDIGEGCITVKTARVYDKNHKLVEKQTKNKSSTRTIPCDPYILDKLNALPRSGEYVIKLSTSGIWTSITKASSPMMTIIAAINAPKRMTPCV